MRTWDEDRVFFYGSDGELMWLPAEWADAVAEDSFVVVAAGRAPFRAVDLLKLAALVNRLRATPPAGAPAVRGSAS